MKSYPFTSQVTYDEQGLPLYDRAVDSDFLRQVFAAYFSDGIFYKPTNALQVVASTGMEVQINPGVCHIQGAIGIEDAIRKLTISPASSQPRITTIVARLDLSQDVRSIDLYAKDGTPAATPAAPALTRDSTIWELGLGNVKVSSNVSTITQADITDTRLDDTRCGVVAQTIGELDTQPYFAQVQALIDELEAEIAGIEQGSEVMLKTTYGGSEDGVVARADTATKLAAERKIGNASFNGTKDITVADIGAEPAFSKNSAFNKNFGSGADTVCQGNDARLSNARRASNITMQLSGTTLRVTYS